MTVPLQPPTVRGPHRQTPSVDNKPPMRSKVSGVLAAIACAVCCALPLLIAAGMLTTAGAAIVEKTLYAVSAGLVVLALSMWWLHRRRSARRAAATGAAVGAVIGAATGSGSCGCAGAGCSC